MDWTAEAVTVRHGMVRSAGVLSKKEISCLVIVKY